jgi:nitroreductase
LFIQNVMLAARAGGLDTCPQVSFVRYQSVIARHLGLGEHDAVVCGMSLGYADASAPVNAIDVSREPVNRIATFLGFDAP